jgi:hypothetical protein
MPISQINTNSIANGAVVAADLAAGAALSNLGSSQLARANMAPGSVLQVAYAPVIIAGEIALGSGGSYTTATVSITPTFSNSVISFFHNPTFLYRGQSTTNNRLIIYGRINGADTAMIKDWSCYSDNTFVDGFRQERELAYFYVPNSTSTQTVGFRFARSSGTPVVVGDGEIKYVWAMEIAP